ncbi:hypothetical protein JKF63_03359 [Porcisia hertigi]|uniref:Uncharacterized protein n=1 Tax=Porcisia hertigi TaxID=2761500 RepID=A0A836LAT4_9TRYP|nr:hypothetical protein JKF63_03359 [Porcisia hertigi]
MWVNDFNQTGVPQESSLLRNEGLTSSHGARTSFSSSSYVAQPARPLPAGVLSADLARPISVRELAQSRALAVPPLPPSATAAAAAAVSAGFAGFGIPTSCAVYAATSGVPMSQRCPTRTGVSDSMSLAYRNIDRLSGDDLYKYASHLQDASRQYSTHLQEAYAKRDQYRSEVAHLKQELQSRYLQIDGLRREQERTSEALLRVKEDNTQLREQLAEAEGRARNIQAKMSLLSGKDPSLAVHFYQSQLALKDAQLRELQQEYERASAAFSQRRSTSATGAASARPSINIPSEGAAAPESLPSRGPLNTGDVQDGDEAASVELRAKLEELQRLNTSLSQRLDEERAAHESALAEHTKASATAAADLTGLHDTIAQLRQQCTELRTSEDKLVAALTQRAPMSKSDYAALQASYSDLTADLAKAEARIAELQEKERRESQIAQQSQEELHNSLAAAIEERQTVQARNEQMQSLVHHLQRELELAEQANQLRQKQLDAAVSGNKGLADNLRIAQEQLLSEASEMEHLRNVRDNLEEQLNELRNRIDDLEREDPPQQQQQQQQPEQHQDTGVGAALGPTASSPGDSKATSDMCALRDALVRDRDDVIVELRQLQEQRLAFLKSPQPPVEEEEAVRQPNSWSATKIPIDLRENDDDDDEGGSRPKENFAELEEARQCIEHMNATMASMQSEHNRVEADLRTQSRALAEAKATSTAQQAHLEEIMKALGDELVATQAQEKELRLSEERHRELCVERQRAVEQLQAHVAELEKAARDAESQHATPVPTPAQTAAAESELSVMNAALESLADQLEDARQQVEQLSAEHARTTEELARATRTVADLEARAAEAESRHEATHAAAEGTAAELTARVTTLAAENAELRERLSTSRAAVTTFASHQTDVEGAVASLEERCASEAQRREAAEAEVLALRAALDVANTAASRSAEQLASLEAARQVIADMQVERDRVEAELESQSRALAEAKATSTAQQAHLEEVMKALGDELVATQAQEKELRLSEERHRELCVERQRAVEQLQAHVAELEKAARDAESQHATPVPTPAQTAAAESELSVMNAAVEQLSAEHARTTEELARATRTVADLEARAAEAESRHEATHAAAEGTAAELTARVTTLAAENAELRERLSTSRAAVTTFASHQTDVEGAVASLEERCASEAQRREAAEAEVLALRAALDVANTAASRSAEQLASLEAARQVIADMQVERDRVEAELESQSRALAEAKATSTAQQAHLEEVMKALGDELVATQAQEKELRLSEERHRELCVERQRAVEQLQAHVAELEKAARDAESQHATPVPTPAQTAAAESELSVMNAAVEQLSAEHARTTEELARATRTVADLEARAAEAESRHEATHAAAEGTAAELTARVTTLAAENAELREKLSTSRAAVTTFASHQTDVEGAVASLEERCASEAQRREAAEAEVLALRAALDVANTAASRSAEQLASLEAARQVIADMQVERDRVEAELESQSRALAEAKATSTAQQAHLEEVMKALGDELVATQAQEKELRLSEERHRELCVERQRAVEQLQAHVAELEKAARDAESQHATPVPTPAQTAAAESELSVMNAAVEQLSAEHARTTEELARATRTVADLEARAAEAESRHEATHAAAEGTAAELTARVTTLAAENAELREKLATSRAAVTTFASHQTDVEGAVASLEERCASEAQRREAAEAEVLALRAALDVANTAASRSAEQLASLEAARQVIADMQVERDRVEAELESQSRALAEAKATSTAQQAHLEEVMKALGDELVATQAQEKELRLSEERHRELCVERQRAVEQLQAHVAELEKAARDAESQHATPAPTPAQTAAAESELSVMNAAVEQLSAEHARTTEELARATRTVADLEARAAEAESRHEATHAAAEGTAAELTARVTTLAAENAELREKLATSRAAVTTFASHQTDVEGAVASLEERCASEAQRREAAEAEVLALRAALDRSAAELLELLQRSEDVQVALTQAVDRLTKEEVLVEELNSDAALHSAERAALADEMTKLQNSLERALLDKEEVLAQLLATQKDLDCAAAGLDAQYEEEERLRVVLEATTSAFSAQTMQVRLAMAHVVDMSKAFCGAVEAAAQGAVSPSEDGESVKKDAATPHCDALARTKGRQCMAARIEKVLSPWGRALDWVATMEQRLEALERGTTTSDTSDADSRPLSRRARRQSRGMAVEDEDVTEVGGSAQVLSASFMQRAVPRSRAEAAFARLIDEQVFATSTIADLRGALADKNVELSNLRSAMNTLASDAIAERDRADSLSAAIDDATEKLALAQAEFEEQLRQRMAATTAEVVEARRSEARAAAAQLSAEQQLAVVEDDLKEQQALVRTLLEENRRLARDVDRLRRSSRSLEVGLRGLSEVTGSVTPASLSPAAAVSPGVAARRFTRSASITEAVEQAQVLQVSSLQADLTRTRQQARELKGREATLQLSCAALEQEITALRPKAMDAEQLREDLAALRADYAELEQRHDQLERMTTAAGGGTMQELKQLRQQLRVREAELEEQKARSRDLMLSKAAPELEAVRRQEALRESLSDITTHLIATQAQYGVSSEDTGVTRSRCGSLAVSRRGSGPLISPASGPSATDVLTDRMKYLQALVHDREVELERAQAAQLESRAVMDTLKDQLVAKAAALERAEGLVAKYADTINTLTTTAMLESGARGGHLTTAPPLCNKADALNNPVSSSAAPPVNQLAPRTCAAVNNETHTTIALTSPAPLMPLFGEVVEGHRNSGTSHSAGTTGSSTDIAPLTANSQRAEASDDQMSARGRHVRRSSSSTKSAASTLSSHSGSARKLSTRGTRGRKRTRT